MVVDAIRTRGTCAIRTRVRARPHTHAHIHTQSRETTVRLGETLLFIDYHHQYMQLSLP